ncbi:chaoptin [Anabrus simplex]|uniref:chaoptin n=1 Tax=Anabrus simplex TaxID=316456 RepID=UPI0035A3001A
MSLGAVVKLGYALVVISMLLMMWASMARARETNTAVTYPPCYFNSLCSCSKAEPDLGIVFCEDVPLPRIPEAINSSKVFMLHLRNNGLWHIEPYFLQGTGVYRLQISENPLPHIPDEAFQGLERSLWELELQHNQLTAVPSRALRHLQKLRLLNLTGNKIAEVSSDMWRGLEGSLLELYLKDNALSTITPDAFSTVPLLETLDLSGNGLVDLEASTFRSGPPRLVRLNLADNQLNAVPYRQLNELHTLRHLDLSYNRIAGLHSSSMNSMVPGAGDRGHDQPGRAHWALDTLRLDHNQIQFLPPGAFQQFDTVNRTTLDGNPLASVQVDAFRDARIRELSLRDCGLSELSPGAFNGLEGSLQWLDLSANNLTEMPHHLFQQFDSLRTVYLHDNVIAQSLKPMDNMNGFQRSLFRLDLSGKDMSIVNIQDLRRFQNLRAVSLSRLSQPHLSPEDFLQFGVDLEELRVTQSNVKTLKNHAFMHARGLKRIDLSENSISQIDPEAFSEIGHSLVSLKMAHGLASSMSRVPDEALRPLVSLQELDLSNNKLRSMPETSFHFLRRMRILELQDNELEEVHKGTFQKDIHERLEEIYMSFNRLNSIPTHAFKDLAALQQLYIDDNSISHIEWRAFMNLGRLRVLQLRGNKLVDIAPEAFQNLPALELLDLAYNELRSLDLAGTIDQVGTLSPAFRLNVSHNMLQALEANSTSTGHVSIKVLDVSHNNITWVGRGALRPVEASLTHLHLAYNGLRNASKEVFGNMPQLQWLDLAHNHLTELDFDTFRNTRRLQVLILSHNELSDVPNEVFRQLTQLREVQLSHNRLRGLPDALFTEDGLERLDLSHNQLSRMPAASLGVLAAASIVEMDLSWNFITSLHGQDVFARFKSLSRLDLSYNRVVRLEDAGFASLPRLSSLDLSHNNELQLDTRGRSFHGLDTTLLELSLNNVSLSSVPEMGLTTLRYLGLAHNRIASLPTELALNLTSLRELDLSYNKLQTVPPATHAMPQLRHLSLAGNPITAMSDTSLLGVAERLHELDIRHLPLTYFETSALNKMSALRTLHVSTYHQVSNLNLPTLVQANHALRNLHVEIHSDEGLTQEMSGPLPHKVRNLTLSGYALRNLPDDVLQGVRSSRFHFALHNTSVHSVQDEVFKRAGWVRNITVDVRNNSLSSLANPSTGQYPGAPRKTFLVDMKLAYNQWSCDCQLGWVEVWQRKRHQYLERRGAEDDLREAQCANKNNASLLEIMKSDIECGWGSGAPRSVLSAPLVFLAAAAVALLSAL